MISFFAKFKQNLLLKSDVNQYFKLASIEFFIVIIGILIALKIDAWNKEEDARAKEAFLLQELHQDFIKNKIVNFGEDTVKDYL